MGQGFKFERGAVPSAKDVMSLAATVAREQVKAVSGEIVEYFMDGAKELLEEESSEVIMSVCLACCRFWTIEVNTLFLQGVGLFVCICFKGQHVGGNDPSALYFLEFSLTIEWVCSTQKPDCC